MLEGREALGADRVPELTGLGGAALGAARQEGLAPEGLEERRFGEELLEEGSHVEARVGLGRRLGERGDADPLGRVPK